MIVLPSVDADGKALNYGDFKVGDRMGLKQPNGSAAIYELEPAAVFGDHFRFNVELLHPRLLRRQDFVFNAPVTAVIEDTSTRTSAAAVMGVGVGETNLGTFTGATLADGVTTKEALQALETGLETGVSGLEGRVAALEVDPTTATATCCWGCRHALLCYAVHRHTDYLMSLAPLLASWTRWAKLRIPSTTTGTFTQRLSRRLQQSKRTLMATRLLVMLLMLLSVAALIPSKPTPPRQRLLQRSKLMSTH